MGESDTPGPPAAATPVTHPAPPAPVVAPATLRQPAPLRSEQLALLADTAAAAIALPVPAVDHERTLPPEALARVLDAVEASTATATKKAYRSDWDRFANADFRTTSWPQD